MEPHIHHDCRRAGCRRGGRCYSRAQTDAVTDAYSSRLSLKTLIVRKLGNKSDVANAIDQLDKKPDSKGRQATLQEELDEAGVENDAEIAALARALLDLLKESNAIDNATSNVSVSRQWRSRGRHRQCGCRGRRRGGRW